MLFPADGVGGIKRFFVDTLVQFGKRGLACQPAIMGLGIGGAKDTCVRLGKEAACLRVVGSRHPDPDIARLEAELTALGNYVGIGAMGFAGTSLVVATHVEVAFTHTGGMPVGIHAFCLSSRRATARIHPGGRVEFRADPRWFTDYYRREGVE
jgi:L(+)-tartrate dehydratase alpha subunit